MSGTPEVALAIFYHPSAIISSSMPKGKCFLPDQSVCGFLVWSNGQDDRRLTLRTRVRASPSQTELLICYIHILVPTSTRLSALFCLFLSHSTQESASGFYNCFGFYCYSSYFLLWLGSCRVIRTRHADTTFQVFHLLSSVVHLGLILV